MAIKTVINAAGRAVPVEINGKPVIPFKGVGKHRPEGRNIHPRYQPVLIILMTAIK